MPKHRRPENWFEIILDLKPNIPTSSNPRKTPFFWVFIWRPMSIWEAITLDFWVKLRYFSGHLQQSNPCYIICPDRAGLGDQECTTWVLIGLLVVKILEVEIFKSMFWFGGLRPACWSSWFSKSNCWFQAN